ncbi:glycogen-binding subunit 76A-like [Ptychodera flava]|uniref:glycogen-binding subunit 76A-like n=1 Tax=Ptychodera flava TaxID=63121 RepID=UPI00396A7D3F
MEDVRTTCPSPADKANGNGSFSADMMAGSTSSGESMPLSKDWCEVKVQRKTRLPNGLVVDTTSSTELELQLGNSLSRDDVDDEVDRPILRKRSPSGSCLKSPGKTPPGSPVEKKSVRFADDLGRQLVQSVQLVKADSGSDIHVPDYVYETLGIYPHDTVPATSTFLKPLFLQPCSDYMTFQSRLRANNMTLENAAASDLTIFGTVKVCNIAYQKSVKIRYTLNEWKSHVDKQATYVTDSCDGPTDRFSFAITAPTDMEIGSRVEFAVCYSVKGKEFWDNNDGDNYKFECQPKDD